MTLPTQRQNKKSFMTARYNLKKKRTCSSLPPFCSVTPFRNHRCRRLLRDPTVVESEVIPKVKLRALLIQANGVIERDLGGIGRFLVITSQNGCRTCEVLCLYLQVVQVLTFFHVISHVNVNFVLVSFQCKFPFLVGVVSDPIRL